MGTGFPPFFAALSEPKQTHGVQSISPGAHQIALVKDIRMQTILNLQRNIFINVFLKDTISLRIFWSSHVPETWTPFRRPNVDTKLRQQCGHPLWVPTFFVVNWGLLLGSWFWVLDFHLFSLSFRGKTNPQCSKRLTGCTSNCTRQRHPSANDTKSAEQHLHKTFSLRGLVA